MKVTLHSPINLGNKTYDKGHQEIPDHLYGNLAFKKHVKLGTVVVHPRDPEAQKAQASKDARALHKAQGIKKAADLAVAARALLTNKKAIVGAPSLVDDFAISSSVTGAIEEIQAAQAAPAESTVAAQATGKDES